MIVSFLKSYLDIHIELELIDRFSSPKNMSNVINTN